MDSSLQVALFWLASGSDASTALMVISEASCMDLSIKDSRSRASGMVDADFSRCRVWPSSLSMRCRRAVAMPIFSTLASGNMVRFLRVASLIVVGSWKIVFNFVSRVNHMATIVISTRCIFLRCRERYPPGTLPHFFPA